MKNTIKVGQTDLNSTMRKTLEKSQFLGDQDEQEKQYWTDLICLAGGSVCTLDLIGSRVH